MIWQRHVKFYQGAFWGQPVWLLRWVRVYRLEPYLAYECTVQYLEDLVRAGIANRRALQVDLVALPPRIAAQLRPWIGDNTIKVMRDALAGEFVAKGQLREFFGLLALETAENRFKLWGN